MSAYVSEFDDQDKEIIKELKQQTDYFDFLGKQISSQEITSMLPFFDCEEPGHDGNALDQVCLEPNCKFKGLSCVRCQYQRHRSHPNSVYPIHTFVSALITQLSSRRLILNQQVQKCLKYRDVVISIIRDYLNGLIDHMTDIVAQLHKYYTVFENSYENIMIRSQIMAHSLVYKKHIRRDKFQRYVRDCVKSVSFNRNSTEYKPSSDYYFLSETKPTSLQEKFKQEQGEIVISEQERAFEMTSEYINEMQKVATKLQELLKKNLSHIQDTAQLHVFSDKIPRFEKVQDIEELQRIKQQFGININNIFKTSNGDVDSLIVSSSMNLPHKAPGGTTKIENSTIFTQKAIETIESYKYGLAPVNNDTRLQKLTVQYQASQRLNNSLGNIQSQIPSLNEFLLQEQASSIIDPSRNICTLGMLFETLSNCSILKQKSLKTAIQEVSCFAFFTSDLIAVAGKFNPEIEVYRLSDRKLVQKIDTKSQQGVKCLMVMIKDWQLIGTVDQEALLIVGLYYDQATILCYKIQIFKHEGKFTVNSIPNGQFYKNDYDSNQAAVTCMKEFYNGEYFIVGFSTGTVALYSRHTSEPINVIKHLYDKAVYGISIVDSGKVFLTFSVDKCRFHYVSSLTSDKAIVNISPLKSLPHPCYCLQQTQSLNEEKSSLQLVHFICGEQKEFMRVEGETREQGIRFLRLMKEDVKVTIVEEGSISNFREHITTNSVKEIILLEPRKKMSKVWVIAIGENNKLQLWECRRAMSQNIKLWEKDLEDFLKPMNHNLIKAKLLCESQEFTSLKYFDVAPKAQIARLTENIHNGRFKIEIAIVNHESKHDIDFFDIELMTL